MQIPGSINTLDINHHQEQNQHTMVRVNWRYLLFPLLVVILLVGCSGLSATPTPTPIPTTAPTSTPTSDTVTFNDENLEAVIRESAIYGSISEQIMQEELASLTGLVASERGIVDLTGIEYCVNLTNLLLFENEISDISPLSSLTKLESLALLRNQISDITPLSSLDNLIVLHLAENQISDISPLASLDKLVALYLHKNQISDLSPLASLTNINELVLAENQISDISPLVNNIGLGEGDLVNLKNNNLDLSEGSDDLENIRLLEERGVTVDY